MSELPTACDVVIIGAGMAGLAAAAHLQRAGLHVVVVESSDGVGGRVRTDMIDGFRLDRGFQLYNPSYPEGQAVFDYDALDLRSFERGARVVIGERSYRLGDPRSHPTWAIDAARAPLGGMFSLLRFATYAAVCAVEKPTKLTQRPDISMREAVQRAGVNETTIAALVQPFLSGVFLEPNLDTSRRFGDLILRSFVRGTPAIPSRGMQALPEQLADGIEVVFNCPATAVRTGQVETTAGTVRAEAVVVAVDPAHVNSLLPLPNPPANACTTWYHVPDQTPGELSAGQALLTIDGEGRGPLVNTAVLTHAAPSYAPPGKSLVSSTAIGTATTTTEAEVRAHLARLYGVSTDRWELIATYRVDPALPAMRSPLDPRQPVALSPGLFVAGDHRDTASIQGALVSGRRAAAAVLRGLRAT